MGSEDKDPRLVETLGEMGQYTTLSHCWGKAQPLTTTSATLEERLQGIPLTLLPQTFREAIHLTRKFQIQYLWIDSLCIYSYRTAMKHLRNLRFMPQFSEGFDFWGVAEKLMLRAFKIKLCIPTYASNLRSLPFSFRKGSEAALIEHMTEHR